MNKKLYYHYRKNDFSTITSRGIGSSSGIIKLSNQYSTEKNINSGIKKENSNNKNSSSISSHSGKDLYADTIKEYNNYLSNNNNNYISTLPYTKENLANNNQNLLFGNKYINDVKDINFDFYKNNQFKEQVKNNNNKSINVNQNKNETEVIKQSKKKNEVENLLSNNNIRNTINETLSNKVIKL